MIGKAGGSFREGSGVAFWRNAESCKGKLCLCKAPELLALTGKAVEPLGVMGKALELVLTSGYSELKTRC